MAMADGTKNNILSAMTGKTSNISIASDCYMGLFTSVGNGFVEPDTEAGYGRALVGSYNAAMSQVMGVPNAGKITNANILYFPEATASWGTVTHFGLFTGKTGGTPFLWAELTAPISIAAGYVPLFRAGKLNISIT